MVKVSQSFDQQHSFVFCEEIQCQAVKNWACFEKSKVFQKLKFSKKTVLKIFIILFEQDCPEAVVYA